MRQKKYMSVFLNQLVLVRQFRIVQLDILAYFVMNVFTMMNFSMSEETNMGVQHVHHQKTV